MDVFNEIRAPRLRIRLPAGGNSTEAVTVVSGPQSSTDGPNTIPCKDWSISDDCLTVSDAASFTVANIDGENTGKFAIGQRVEIDESDPDVAQGQWTRQMTGRIIGLDFSSDISGGSTILVSVMDLGWHLTVCHATPLFKMLGIKLAQLFNGYTTKKGQKVGGLIDPSWGFAPASLGSTEVKVTLDNLLNRTLKQGRTGAQRQLLNNNLQVLPFIQVEPGQSPWDILATYVKREGFLLNVGAAGDIVLFQPDYSQNSAYEDLAYYPSTDNRRRQNNIEGRPTLHESIDGVYSTSECWSTVVNPQLNDQANQTFNPNAQYTHTKYSPDVNPLPFRRQYVVSDSEAINATMRKNRAVFAYQMGLFQSWEYTCEVPRHSSGGVFYVSDTLQAVKDAVHGLDDTFFVQRVQRSVTQGRGVMTKLTLRQSRLLDPLLERSVSGKKPNVQAARK